MRWAVVFALLTLAGAASAAEPFDPFRLARVDGQPGAQVPLDGPFRDEAGRAVTLREIADGRPILLAPVQHRCPNICGATLEGLGRAVDGQATKPGRDVEIVAFGIDPRETPADAAVSAGRLRAALHGRPAHALVGAAADVAAVTGALGYRYVWDPRIGQYAHVAAVAVLTPDGRLSTWLYGVQPPPEVLQAAVGGAGRGSLGGLGDRILLLCYHYAPTVGRYGPAALTALKIVAGACVLALAGFIAASLVRERRRRAAP
jgi:protein SCO1/2